jgi:hypothetical protein
MARALGEEAQCSMAFCGEMHVGWGGRDHRRDGGLDLPCARRRGRRRDRAGQRATSARCRNQPAADRRTGPRQSFAAGADAGAGGARCLQSLRLLRAAVPAVDDGASKEPHAHAGHRRRLRRHLRPHVLRLHGGLAQRLPALRPSGLGDAGRRCAGGLRRCGQRQGLLLVRKGPDPVHPRIEKARHLPPHAQHPRRRKPAGDDRGHGLPRHRRQLLRVAVHRRLSHGLYAPADAGRTCRRPAATAIWPPTT